MTARVVASVLRMGLLAGMLAIIAGILGMHILTGSPSIPASAGADLTQTMGASGSGDPTLSARAASATDNSSSVTGTSIHRSWCADPDWCAAMSPMAASCTLSPGSPPPAAHPPSGAPFAAPLDADVPPAASTYAYLPVSPSPGRLCISRT